VSHLLVTNDFPPKVGGIQRYLYDLWSRLPAEELTVLAPRYDGDAGFDAAQRFRIERYPAPVLLPTPRLVARVRRLAGETGAGLVLFDPGLPLGLVGPRLGLPYGIVLHGAEVTVPARLPVLAPLLRDVLCGACLLIAAGDYPAREAARLTGRVGSDAIPTVVVPPGVDLERFRPLPGSERAAIRQQLDIGQDKLVVLSLSRLVPRKGMDRLIEAVGSLAPSHPELLLLIGGTGRDAARLDRLAERYRAPARFLGYVRDDELPGLYRAADLFAMLCRNRWFGLEQEGFGVVFLEAAACGVAALAGRSGGADDAVRDGVTGLVLDRPEDAGAVATALRSLIEDEGLRVRLGQAGRERVVDHFERDRLAGELASALRGAARGSGYGTEEARTARDATGSARREET